MKNLLSLTSFANDRSFRFTFKLVIMEHTEYKSKFYLQIIDQRISIIRCLLILCSFINFRLSYLFVKFIVT